VAYLFLVRPNAMPRPRIVTPDKEKAWIYGFYDDAAKEFLYVGQTLEPYYRRKAHVQGRLAKPELQSPTVRYIVLRQTTAFHVSRIESQIIRCLQRRGQCRLNRSRGSPMIRSPRIVTHPIACSNGMIFIGKAQAARYFDVSVSTIRNAFQRGGEITGRNGRTYFIWLRSAAHTKRPNQSLEPTLAAVMPSFRVATSRCALQYLRN
jgi:hypothetical protein